MDNLTALLDGLATVVQPVYLLYALFGVFVGTAVGVLPGIGPAMTIALLLPLTYSLDDGRHHRVRRHLLRRHLRG